MFQPAFLTSRMKAPRHRQILNLFIHTDRTFIFRLLLDLLEDMYTINRLYILHALVLRCTILVDECRKIHIVCKPICRVSSCICFLFIRENVSSSNKRWMATGLAEPKDLSENGGVGFEESAAFDVGVDSSLDAVVNMVVNKPFLFRKINMLDHNLSRWKRNKRTAVRAFHVFCPPHDERFQYRLYHVERLEEILLFKWNSDECPPESKIAPWFYTEESDEREEIFESVDNRRSRKYPAVGRLELITSFSGLAVAVLDIVSLVENDAVKSYGEQAAVLDSVYPRVCNVTEFRKNGSIGGDDDVWG